MANGFDRLERLFAYRRKASSASSGPASPAVQPPEPQFPSPSFIRPKATRMAAREEVGLKQTASRSPSVPDIMTAQPMQYSHTHHHRSADGPFQPNHRLGHPPSFNSSRQLDRRLAVDLREFQFPKPPSRNGGVSPLSPSFNTTSQAPRLPSPRRHSPLQVATSPRRLATPPSDPEDNTAFSLSLRTKALPELPRAPPTPGESPKARPMRDLQLHRPLFVDAIDQAGLKAGQNNTADQASLHRLYSQSSVAPSAQNSFDSSTLREPDFNEFLNLSDDDIAEFAPESPALPPMGGAEPALPAMGLSISSSQPLTSLLTLSPPHASRPAAVAAFEAARIARRYDFDLVYVVNLWPDSAGPRAQGPRNPGSKPMVGRLLAAHGLHHVPSPLQISSVVHSTILRAHGWIEYRNEDAQPHDLARGYACAFHTGQYVRPGMLGKNCPGPVSGVLLSERIDRGIVFAAYRKPRSGGEKLGRAFSKEKLGELHREAEALIELFIDIHVANRLREPATAQPSLVPDETGPMPVQQLETR